jgi:hypothetical protein
MPVGKHEYLAPAFAVGLEDPQAATHWYRNITADGISVNQVPVINSFYESAFLHVGDSQTDGPFMSVTAHPQVAWQAAAGANERWRGWTRAESLVVHRFKMNSFYAISRNEILPQFDRATGAFKLGSRGGTLPANDPSVEYLVPVALPANWREDGREFRPTFGADGRPEAFPMVTPSAWAE